MPSTQKIDVMKFQNHLGLNKMLNKLVFNLNTLSWVKCYKSFLMIFILLWLTPCLYSQREKQKELEQRRKKLNEQLKANQRELKDMASAENITLNQLDALVIREASRAKILETIAQEQALIETRLTETETEVRDLELKQETLKRECTLLYRHAFKTRHRLNPTLMLLDASDFKNAISRWNFMRQYHRFRSRQFLLYQKNKESIKAIRDEITQQKALKSVLYSEAQAQVKAITEEQNYKKSLVKKIQSNKKQLENDIQKIETARQELTQAIEMAIREELRAEKTTTKTNANTVSANTSGSLNTTKFVEAKGMLPSPLKSDATIISRFGVHTHPDFKFVQRGNTGIDLLTQSGANVQAIFAGKCILTLFKTESLHIVVIQHGTYFSAYSQLAQINIKKGDLVKAGQLIGDVGKNLKGQYVLHFEIWRGGNTPIDPADWIKI